MLQALIGPVAGLLDKFIPDADEKMKIAAELSCMAAPFGIVVPQADTGTMLPVLMGMLGLGGMRTMERVKGVGK